MSQSPHLKCLPKKFQISYLTSFSSGNTVLFKIFTGYDNIRGSSQKTKFKILQRHDYKYVDLARKGRFRKWIFGAKTPTTADRPGYRYGLVMKCSSCSILHPVFMLKKGKNIQN